MGDRIYINSYIFGENLKKLVRYKQQQESTDNYFKTVRDIAKDLGISYQSLLNYQAGKRIPNYDTLLKMQDYFDVDEIDLFIDKVKTDKNCVVTIPKKIIVENSKPDNVILTDIALKNLLAYSKSKSEKDKERHKIINQLLERPQMLDNLIELLNGK